MAEGTTPTIETERQALKEGKTLVELWLAKIKRARDLEEKWRKDVDDALKVYAGDDEANIAFNIMHSNIETILPSAYNSTPVPDVRRRFSDADPVAKQVCDLAERLIIDSIDGYDFDATIKACVRDVLATGRGVPRIRYTPYLENDEIRDQNVTTERVPWDRYVQGPAECWERVPFVAFKHDLTKEELEKLNPRLAGKIKLTGGSELSEDEQRDPVKRGLLQTAEVYEIWDRTNKRCLFIAECYPEAPIRDDPDPLQIDGFMPVMRPLQIMQDPRSMVPICPHKLYRKLYEELDLVTKRISKLIRMLRVRGLYDSEMEGDFEQLSKADDGQFKAVKNAARFVGNGAGLEGALWMWPLEPIIAALQQLYIQRDQIKATIYEVTGISDIVRGASNANETATAQNIKSQWGSLRIQNLQASIARMVRDIFRAKVSVFARHYDDQMLMMKSNLPQSPEQQQMWPQVLQVFRSEMRQFRIDVETDSTIRADLSRNQEQMNMFLAGTGQFATAAAGAAQQFGPKAMPVLAEVYTGFARMFKLGKQAEDALDNLSTMAREQAEAPQEDKPDPEQQKIEMQMQMAQQKADLDMQTAQAKLQMEGQSLQAKAAHEERMAQLAEQKAVMEIEIKKIDLQMKMQAAQIDAQSKAMDAQIRRQSAVMDMEDRESAREHEAESNAIRLQGMKDKQSMKPEART